MPIRFRCPHCNQRLGIARRKAGTEVQCPKCRAAVLVPPADMEPAAEAPAPAPAPPAALGAGPQVFERSDFEDYLKQPIPREPAPPGPAMAGGPLPHHPDPAPAPAPIPQPAPPELFPHPSPLSVSVEQPPGLFLSPTQATVLTVIAILLLALAFGAGLWVGRCLL